MDGSGTRWMPLIFALVGAGAAVVAAPIAEGMCALVSGPAPAGAGHVPSTGAPTDLPTAPPQNEPAVGLAPPPPDFQARLAPRAGRSGDVQVSLIWNDTNDLDLHCVGPDGHEICPATRETLAPTGGTMDLDANAACHAAERSTTPVENIYWPIGRAPAGAYRVYVSAYERCEPASITTRYRVNVLANGTRRETEGELVIGARSGKQFVTEFTVERPAALTAPPTPEQPPAAAPAPAAGPEPAPRRDPRPPALAPGLCVAPLGGVVALALFAATNQRLNRRPLVTFSRVAVAAATGAAAFGGAWAGRSADEWVHADGAVGVGTALGWVLVAVLVTCCVSFFPPRIDLKKRAIVGAVGGLAAAGAYFAGAGSGEWIGRLLAGLVIGGAAGAVGGGALTALRPTVVHPPSVPPAPPPLPRSPVVPEAKPAPAAPKISPPRTAPAKPPAAAPAAPKVTAAPCPVAGKPPIDPDACPYCRNGTKHPGAPGARYCMIHDQTY